MLEYDRIDISEWIDIKQTNASKESKICHYWYFKDIDFKYEPHLCNGCHGLMTKKLLVLIMLLLFLLKRVLTKISFGIWAKMMGLTEWIILFWLIKSVFYKILRNEWMTYYQRNRDVILNRARDYKQRLRKQVKDKYRNLPEEDKNVKKRIWKTQIS